MRGNIRTKLTLIASMVLFLLGVGSAEAIKLRYIRIGEHETFTRIVFEFHSPVRFEDPVIKERGKFSVVFLDTTTTLPRQILCESTKRVDSIELVPKESNLTAGIALSFPYFRIKSFSLSSPERVVLDIYRTSAPPKGVVLEESIDKKSQEKIQRRPAEKKPTVSLKRAPAEQARKDLEKPGMVSDKAAMQAPRAPSRRPPLYVSKQAPAQRKTQAAQKKSQVTPPEGKSPTVSPKYDHLHIYLLAILIALSVIIIALLGLILFQKRRGSGQGHPDTALDAGFEADESMAAIDAKIKEEFKKYDQS